MRIALSEAERTQSFSFRLRFVIYLNFSPNSVFGKYIAVCVCFRETSKNIEKKNVRDVTPNYRSGPGVVLSELLAGSAFERDPTGAFHMQ